MATTQVPALDRTVQQTQAWLGHITQDMGWHDNEKSYVALRAVLHALRDRLPPDQAVDLASQLPMLVRGVYFEGWKPSATPLTYGNKEAFLARVQRAAPKLEPQEVEAAVSAVFRELSTELEWEEVEEARDAVPAEIRDLWPEAEG